MNNENEETTTVTPAEEAASDTTNETNEATSEEAQTEEATTNEEAATDSKLNVGEAMDGTEYTLESPAVVAFMERFPEEQNTDIILGSVVSMHNRVLGDEVPAGDNIEKILELIGENIAAKRAAQQETAEQQTTGQAAE